MTASRVRDGEPPTSSGSYGDAETLRRWAFLKRTPEQRLAWLIEALEIAYRTGALKPHDPGAATSAEGEPR